MRIAFFIAAHKLERQFEWLFRSIWNEDDIFVIHISTGAAPDYVRELERITEGCNNVNFLPRTQITWGGWSIAEMNLAAIRFLCSRSENWGYFINLSGQDYPLRPLDHLKQFLIKHNGTNFIQRTHINANPFHIRRRLHWYCIEYSGQLRRLPIPNVRAILSHVQWYGRLWCILGREFCDWLATSEFTDIYRQALRHTKCPDEFLFQSIIEHSPFANTLNLNSGRYLEFEPGSPSPKTLTLKDFDRMIESNAFFGRKFDETVDAEVLRHMAERIGATVPQAG
jgi:hypothetical protein